MNKEKKMTWYDVTFRQFMLLQDMVKIEDETERMIAIAELFFGNDVTSLPLPEFKNKVRMLGFLKEAVPENVPPKKVDVNGKKYSMDCLLGNVTTAQYVDYMNFAKMGDMNKMMSVFLIPDGHKYNDGYDIEQVFKDIEDIPIPVVNSAAFFFARQLAVFMRIFQRCLTKKVKKMGMKKEEKEAVTELVNKSMDMVLYPIS